MGSRAGAAWAAYKPCAGDAAPIPMLTVGGRFPEYKARACLSLGPSPLGDVSNAHHRGKWAVYVFYPKDFTFVGARQE